LAGGLVYIQSIHPGSAFVGPHSLERPLQVLSRQHRHEQRRPCVPGVMSRAVRFVADGITRGFTARYARPPRRRGHLTHYVLHRHGLEHFSSFGPSPHTSGYYGLC
jgi:hypothetical protein